MLNHILYELFLSSFFISSFLFSTPKKRKKGQNLEMRQAVFFLWTEKFFGHIILQQRFIIFAGGVKKTSNYHFFV